MSMQPKLDRYDVQVLGRQFQFAGQMEPVGRVLDYFNRGNRSTFSLYDVKLFPLLPNSPFTGITRSEITVSDSELGLIYFLDADYRRQVQVMKNSDPVIAYTPHAVLRGRFHRGAETRLRDLFDLMDGNFVAMTDVSVFVTTSLPAPFPQRADLLIVNRLYVNLYHAE